MTIINPNSIAGITSVTAQADIINFYKSNGTPGSLQIDGCNFNTTNGISTFNNLNVGGTLTYEDVKNVDSVGVVTARAGINLTGGNITLGDSGGNSDDKLVFGADGDLKIFHNGTNNYIDVAAGSGHLYIRPKNNFYIQDYTNGEVWIAGILNGGTYLYHNGNLKAETTANGFQVTNGYLDLNNYSGSGASLRCNSAGTFYAGNAAQGDLAIYVQDNTNNSIILQANTGEKYLEANMGGSVDVYHHGTKKLETTSAGIDVSGAVDLTGTATSSDVSNGGMYRHSNGYTYFGGKSDGNGGVLSTGDGTATVFCIRGSSSDSYIKMETGNGSEKLRITSGGEVLIGSTTDANIKLDAVGSIRAQSTGYVAPTSGVGLEFYYATNVLADTPTGYIVSYDRDAGAYKKLQIDGYQIKLRTQGNPRITVDESGNVGIGTETPTDPATILNTSVTSAGIVTAYRFYGDGSNLSGITTGGGSPTAWTQDSYANLKAGTDAGGAFGSNTLGNIAIGSSSAARLDTGDYNVSIGTSAGVNMTSGLSNVVIGHCAAYHSSGSSHRNIYMGQEAGKCKQGGGSNIGLGLYALYGSSTPGNNTSSGNIALGECAGKANTSGSYNLLFGRSAGENTTTGSCNVIIGSFAAGSGTITSQHNVIFGKEAAKNITSGGDNFIGGYRAVGSGTLTGSYNAIFGREAGCSLTSGGDNFIAGRRAACGATSAHNSIIIGYLAASGATLTGNQNILMGTAVAKNLIGAYNVMFGLHSGCQLSDASHNVFVGHYTAKNNTGNMCYSVAIGHKTDLPITAGNTQLAIGCNGSYWMVGNSSFNVGIGTTNPDAPVGSNNEKRLAVGILSAYQLYGDGSNLSGTGLEPDAQKNLLAGTCAGCNFTSSGCYNIVFGECAGESLTSADCNIIFGFKSLCSLTTGIRNIAIGVNAGRDVTSSSTGNIFIGEDAGLGDSQLTSYNVAIGQEAGRFLCGGSDQDNVFVGCKAGYRAKGGGCNVALGAEAGQNLYGAVWSTHVGYRAGYNSCCHRNTFLGACAGYNITSGRCNVAIGYNVCPPSATGDHQLAIGDGTNRWITGNCDFNVGIGTTNPSSRLSVAGDACVSGVTTFAGPGTSNADGSTTISKGLVVIRPQGANSATLTVCSSESSGAAGPIINLIRDDGAPADDDVLGNIKFNGSDSAGNQLNYVQLMGITADVTDGTEDGTLQIKNVKAGSETITAEFRSDSLQLLNGTSLTAAGDVSAPNFNSTSDIRYKTNIKPIDDPISKVIQIEGVSFNWKKDDKPALGVIADQVEKILPQLVHGDDPKTVNYNGLVGLLIEVVKDQQKQIDTLSERISKLE